MSEEGNFENIRPQYDTLLKKIAHYICAQQIERPLAYETAELCLIDSIGCAILALSYPACKKLLGPWVPGSYTPNGARVLGTSDELDPIKAAFDLGTMIRWLDYNDTWLAKEWGHPSDNIGGILSVMDYVSRRGSEYNHRVFTLKDLLTAMIKAYEIQGMLALENSFNQVGLDHVLLVKLATCGIVTQLMGGTEAQVVEALSQVFVDGQSLRTYRHAPNTGSRKSWAAGDATSRGVRLAFLSLQGEKGYPSAVTAKPWGFEAVSFKGETISLVSELGSYVIENILFKVAYPAEFHAQTAVECALKIYQEAKPELTDIVNINIKTHQAAMRIINKTGPLYNPADRDHCLQYMVAVALSQGELTGESYEDDMAHNPLIDFLRSKMTVEEDRQYTKDYLDPDMRSIANKITITFNSGRQLSAEVAYPLGHKRRRKEGVPLLWEKFENNLKGYYNPQKSIELIDFMKQGKVLWGMSIPDFVDQWIIEQ